MPEFSIDNNNNIVLPLHSHRSKIRIADDNGNHITRVTECRVAANLFVEWMIPNTHIKDLITHFFSIDDKNRIKYEINNIHTFFRASEFATRQASRGEFMKDEGNFKIYRYAEVYYSYERITPNEIINKVVFKMGDYTLAPHFFILIPFLHTTLSLQNNRDNSLQVDSVLGSGAKGIWAISKEDIENLIITISNCSDAHKQDMISFLS